MSSPHRSAAPIGLASCAHMGRTRQLRRPWPPGPASLPSLLSPVGSRGGLGPVPSFPPGTTERFNSLDLHPRVQGLRVRGHPQCRGLWARAGASPPFTSPKAAAQPPRSAGDKCLRHGPGNSPVLAAPCRVEPMGKSSPCSGEPVPHSPAAPSLQLPGWAEQTCRPVLSSGHSPVVPLP